MSERTVEDMATKCDLLFVLQEPFNNGRGISCVRSLCHYLKNRDMVSFKAVMHTEWDKIRNYPEVVSWLRENFAAEIPKELKL